MTVRRAWTVIAWAAMAAVWLGLLAVIGVMTHARWTEYVTVYAGTGALAVMLGWLVRYCGRHRAVRPGRVRAVFRGADITVRRYFGAE